MTGHYVLNGKYPVRWTNLIQWAIWMQENDRTVAQTELAGVVISTVFIGLDHAMPGQEPLLFETMVFNDYDSAEQRRYSTWADAEIGHAALVKEYRERLDSLKNIT